MCNFVKKLILLSKALYYHMELVGSKQFFSHFKFYIAKNKVVSIAYLLILKEVINYIEFVVNM